MPTYKLFTISTSVAWMRIILFVANGNAISNRTNASRSRSSNSSNFDL